MLLPSQMKRPIKPILQILTVEIAVMGLLVLVVRLIDQDWVSSIVVGSLVFIVPSAYFTFYALLFAVNREPRWFLSAFIRGQTGKLMLAAVGFALAFKFVEPLHAPTVFIAYGVLMLVHVVMTAKVSKTLSAEL
jgi:F0F1-type ATP synthase, subunit I